MCLSECCSGSIAQIIAPEAERSSISLPLEGKNEVIDEFHTKV